MQPAVAVPQADPPPIPVLVTPAFSVGGVIGKTFSTWSKNLVPFTVLAAIVHLPTFAVGLWSTYATYGGYPSFQQMMEKVREQQAAAGPFAQWTPLMVIGQLVMIVLTLVEFGALTYGSFQHLAGRKVSVGALLGAGLKRALPVFLAGLFAGLLVMGGTLLLIVPGVILFCATSVAIPAAVAERKGPVEAIRRSFALTKGRRFSICLSFLVMGLIAWTVSVVVGFVPLALGGGIASLSAAVVAYVLGAMVAPLWALLPAVAYHDLRVTKEGADTMELARVFE